MTEMRRSPSTSADSGSNVGSAQPTAPSTAPDTGTGTSSCAQRPVRRLRSEPRDLVRGVRVETGQPDPTGHRRWRGGHRDDGEQRAAAVIAQHAVRPQRVAAVVAAHHPPGGQQVAVLLVHGDPLGKSFAVGGTHRLQVPLDAEVPEHRRGGPEVQRVGAPGRVRGGRGDVAAHELRGHQQRGPALDRLPLQRVVAVAGPDPVGALQDLGVDAGTAGGTALDLQARCAARSSSSWRYTARVWPCTAGRPPWPASTRSRLWSHFR